MSTDILLRKRKGQLSDIQVTTSKVVSGFPPYSSTCWLSAVIYQQLIQSADRFRLLQWRLCVRWQWDSQLLLLLNASVQRDDWLGNGFYWMQLSTVNTAPSINMNDYCHKLSARKQQKRTVNAACLTLWRRNFLLNFGTFCIWNVNNTGTKKGSIMK